MRRTDNRPGSKDRPSRSPQSIAVAKRANARRKQTTIPFLILMNGIHLLRMGLAASPRSSIDSAESNGIVTDRICSVVSSRLGHLIEVLQPGTQDLSHFNQRERDAADLRRFRRHRSGGVTAIGSGSFCRTRINAVEGEPSTQCKGDESSKLGQGSNPEEEIQTE